ncbi:hypothetical protein LJ739_14390 [Aestuariibacter halophilus]|uniref:Uncharacterized protein n=1 Tax=Fluctibacter halophilus TaxID=226011 RepID=A0ABS8GA91_9ALTE|nr:hypothetical protein [Aestuariibacter halophilus]MCC2617438.1 hypothetical protein [Aestuariibacter halophilus]
MIFSVEKRDKHGYYTLQFDDQVLRLRVGGSIGTGLAAKFDIDVATALKSIPPGPWIYFGDMRGCDGYTRDAESQIIETQKMALASGCVADAYCIDSPVARSQVDNIRRSAGIPGDILSCCFDTPGAAMDYLQQALDAALSKTS